MRFIYHNLDRHEEALKVTIDLYSVLDKPSMVEVLRKGLEGGSYQNAMLAGGRELEKLSTRSYLAPLQVAVLFNWGGETDKAAEWVEKAYDQRDPEAPYIKNMIFLSQQVKRHPRVKSVIEKLFLSRKSVRMNIERVAKK